MAAKAATNLRPKLSIVTSLRHCFITSHFL